MLQIICIKLTSGEDLIARIKSMPLTAADPFATAPYSIPQGEVVLEQVRVISLQPVSRTEMGISLIPYLLADYDAPVRIDLVRHAVAVYKASTSLENSYLQQTSPLELGAKSSIQMS